MSAQDPLAPLKAQWKMERRILAEHKWKIERRIAELDDMLANFFPEKADG